MHNTHARHVDTGPLLATLHEAKARASTVASEAAGLVDPKQLAGLVDATQPASPEARAIHVIGHAAGVAHVLALVEGIVARAPHVELTAAAELGALVRALERAEARARDTSSAARPQPGDTAEDGFRLGELEGRSQGLALAVHLARRVLEACEGEHRS